MKLIRKIMSIMSEFVTGVKAICLIVKYNVKNRKRVYEVICKDGMDAWFNMMTYDLEHDRI